MHKHLAVRTRARARGGRERHQRHLSDAAAALRRAQAAGPAAELAAEELRAAARALGRLTGAIDTEAVLDSVFAEFCIGK
jgi:tRNA modification GTPase